MKRALLVVIVALAAVPVSPARASWSEPVPILGKADGQSWLDKLSDGSVIAVGNYDYGRGPIKVAVRPPGGAFGTPVPITPPQTAGYGIVTGPNGRAAFISSPGLFAPPDAGGSKLALRDPDGGWRSVDAPADLWPGVGAFDTDGNVTYAGPAYDGTNHLGTITIDPSGAVTARRMIAPSGYNARAADIVITPDGTTLVQWYAGPRDGHVYLSSAPPGQDFGPPETIASGMHGETAALSLERASDGSLLATFSGASRYLNTDNGVLYTSLRPPGGEWGRPEPIPADPVTNLDGAAFAMNRAGDAVLAWHGGTTVDQRLAMSFRPAGGQWEAATVGPPGTGSMPLVGVGGDGAAIVSDRCYVQCDPMMFVSYDHLKDGGFGAPADIAPVPTESDATSGMELAVDAAGDAVAVWNWAGHGVFSSVHRVGTATGPGTPSVDSFAVATGTATRSVARMASKPPRLFSYRLSRRARIAIRIERVASDGKRVRLAKLSAALQRGKNVSPIPPDVAARLLPGRRYRATIVAIGRNGHRSTPRSVTFTR